MLRLLLTLASHSIGEWLFLDPLRVGKRSEVTIHSAKAFEFLPLEWTEGGLAFPLWVTFWPQVQPTNKQTVEAILTPQVQHHMQNLHLAIHINSSSLRQPHGPPPSSHTFNVCPHARALDLSLN